MTQLTIQITLHTKKPPSRSVKESGLQRYIRGHITNWDDANNTINIVYSDRNAHCNRANVDGDISYIRGYFENRKNFVHRVVRTETTDYEDFNDVPPTHQ